MELHTFDYRSALETANEMLPQDIGRLDPFGTFGAGGDTQGRLAEEQEEKQVVSVIMLLGGNSAKCAA